MEYTEHPTGDGHKWVRFYLHDLPFETYTEEDTDQNLSYPGDYHNFY